VQSRRTAGLAAGAGAAVLGALLWAAPAAAQVPACAQVTAVPVAFGAYDERVATPVNGTGQVRVQCDAGVNYQVSLDPGAHSGGTFSPRVMGDAGGQYKLQYNLYLDGARTIIWGDGTGLTQVVTGVAQGAQDILQVYGRIFALQPVGVGLYADTVTVTVDY
jgi:spore coat protein U domain-containing protein, fimbrial subunit CupE1/2/3/6